MVRSNFYFGRDAINVSWSGAINERQPEFRWFCNLKKKNGGRLPEAAAEKNEMLCRNETPVLSPPVNWMWLDVRRWSIRWTTHLIRSLDGLMKRMLYLFSACNEHFIITERCVQTTKDDCTEDPKKKNILIRDNAPNHVQCNICLILSSRSGTEQLQAGTRLHTHLQTLMTPRFIQQ